MRLMSGGQGRGPYRAPHRAAVDEDGSLRLGLDGDDDRLPWLEGDEEDDEPELDRGRIAAFALAFLLLALVLGALAWWLWQSRARAELVADGSTIEAPQGPYKVRPRNAGGREVLGTGNTSFAVAEGRGIEGRIADDSLPPEPAAEYTDEAAPDARVAPGVAVQIGAYPTQKAAQAGWQQLSTRLPPLNGRGHRILEGAADSGTVFRLQVVAENPEAARQLCSELRAAGGECQVKR